MFTDIVDSTRLVEVVGDAKWTSLLGWHDRTLRELIEAQGGEVIKQTGDGYFAAIQTPASAVDTAVASSARSTTTSPWPPDVRIGVHTGGAVQKSEGNPDYAGEGVHMAARIGAFAAGGEILVSREGVDGASRFSLSEPRQEELKGFDGPVELVSVAWR